jgi:hypothetical protein
MANRPGGAWSRDGARYFNQFSTLFWERPSMYKKFV